MRIVLNDIAQGWYTPLKTTQKQEHFKSPWNNKRWAKGRWLKRQIQSNNVYMGVSRKIATKNPRVLESTIFFSCWNVNTLEYVGKKIANPWHTNCSHSGSLKLIPLLLVLPTNPHNLCLIMLVYWLLLCVTLKKQKQKQKQKKNKIYLSEKKHYCSIFRKGMICIMKKWHNQGILLNPVLYDSHVFSIGGSVVCS